MFIYVLLLGLLFAVCYFGVAIYYINLPDEFRVEPSRLFGGARRDRTADLLHAISHRLILISYNQIVQSSLFWSFKDSKSLMPIGL